MKKGFAGSPTETSGIQPTTTTCDLSFLVARSENPAEWDAYIDMQNCLHQLSPRQQLLFNLFYVEGNSYRTIAQRLNEGIKPASYKKALRRATKNLREMIKKTKN